MKNTICVHPENPHYYCYKGSPIMLITSAEHYGGVINKAFDYRIYFDTLQSYGLNYTRIYCGAHSEHQGMFIDDNPLAPAKDQLVLPWARSSVPGCIDGGNKFDLDRWDEEYFLRLKDFISEAEKRDIIVEVCLYNVQYPETWPYCPMNAGSNIQNIGNCSYFDVQSCKDIELLEYQVKYAEKITTEVNGFDNVILEIIDEPTLFGANSRDIVKWIDIMADTIIKAEKDLENKHLIAQQLEIGVDYTSDGRVAVIVAQYTHHVQGQVGGMMALDSSYSKNKPIEVNETCWLPIWYAGDAVIASRVELWEFIIGGGAGFNQLNGYFTVNNPAGDNEQNNTILKAMSAFVSFINSFDFIRMTRDTGFIVKTGLLDTQTSAISEKGKQYAAYFHHSHSLTKGGPNISYIANPGRYKADVVVNLPSGDYKVEWIFPENAGAISSSVISHSGGELELGGPEYTVDIALRIMGR